MRVFWAALIFASAANGQLVIYNNGQPARLTDQEFALSNHLSQAYKLIEARDWEGAEKEYRAAAALPEPDGQLGTMRLSGFLESRGRSGEIEALFHDAFERTKRRAYLADGASVLVRVGKTEAARKIIAPLVESLELGEPLGFTYSQTFVAALRGLGDMELALRAARSAEGVYRGLNTADKAQTLMTNATVIVEILDDLGRTSEALLELESLAAEFPNEPFVLNNYSYHLTVLNKNLEKALDLAYRARKLKMFRVFMNETVGPALIKLGRPEEAVDDLVARWRSGWRTPSVRTTLAQALAKRPSRSEPLTRLLELLAAEPSANTTPEITNLLSAIGE